MSSIKNDIKLTVIHFFREIFANVTIDVYDYTGFYTIVLTEYIENSQEIIRQILKDCWSKYITNVVVLVATKNYERVLLYTYFPYTAEHCEHIKPIVHDYFENGKFAFNATIFPKKFQNFFKCPLYVSAIDFPPFMILNSHANGSIFTDGIEGIMLSDMSRYMNFTPFIIKSALNTQSIHNSSKPSSLDLVS